MTEADTRRYTTALARLYDDLTLVRKPCGHPYITLTVDGWWIVRARVEGYQDPETGEWITLEVSGTDRCPEGAVINAYASINRLRKQLREAGIEEAGEYDGPLNASAAIIRQHRELAEAGSMK